MSEILTIPDATNITTAGATLRVPSLDWTDCTPDDVPTPDEPAQEADAITADECPEVCDGADPEPDDVQEKRIDDSCAEDEDSDLEPLDIDSILPLAEKLESALRVVANRQSKNAFDSYYFDGTPPDEELRAFEAYADRVEIFTLDVASLQGFSFGSILRMSMMPTWPGALFRNLKTLHVVHCDSATMQALNLFLSSSLEGLEVVLGDKWDRDCDQAMDSFVAALSCEAPNLTTLKIKKAEAASCDFFSPISPEFCPFDNLLTLHLEEVVIDRWPVLQALGELRLLEDLTLNTVLRRHYKPRIPSSADDEEWDVLSDSVPVKDVDFPGFPRLRSLRVAARINVLRDLFGYIDSNDLYDLSVTLLAGSTASQTLDTLRGHWTSRKTISDHELIDMVRNGQCRFTFRNEDLFFCLLLDRAGDKWKDLQFLSIDHRQSADRPHRYHFLSTESVEKLLLHPRLQQLEILSWVIDFDLGKLLSDIPPTHKSDLTFLHLPTNSSSYEETGGIPWTSLATINNKFPKLTSFYGYLDRHISNIPDYTAGIPDSVTPNFDLETLALGDGVLSWGEEDDSNYMMRVGVYLYSLFPNLDTVIAEEEEGEEALAGGEWAYLKRLVGMCQASSRFGNRARS